MLKFLVDESAGKKLSGFLQERGFNVNFVTDILPGAADKEVLEFAENEGRVLITNDKDFGELVFRFRRPSSGVILLRLKIDSPLNRQKHISALIDKIPDKLESHFIAVSEGKTRIRKLE